MTQSWWFCWRRIRLVIIIVTVIPAYNRHQGGSYLCGYLTLGNELCLVLGASGQTYITVSYFCEMFYLRVKQRTTFWRSILVTPICIWWILRHRGFKIGILPHWTINCKNSPQINYYASTCTLGPPDVSVWVLDSIHCIRTYMFHKYLFYNYILRNNCLVYIIHQQQILVAF